MKKIIAIAILGGATSAAFASFTESFDTGPTTFMNATDATWGNAAGGVDMAFSSGTWHAQNESTAVGGTGWFNTSGAVTPVWASHSGAGQLNANFNNTGSTGTINNWMMTPTLSLTNGDTFSFWTRTSTGAGFPDRLIVKMSLAGASTTTSNFSTTLLTINAGLASGPANYPDVWTLFTATVTGLGGPTSGRLAFNYNVTGAGLNGNNSDFIGIDDVTYTSSSVPEPATFAVLGVGALALIRRRRNKS